MGGCLHRDCGRVSDLYLTLVLDTLSAPLKDVERVRSPRPPRNYERASMRLTDSPSGQDRGDRQMNQWVALDYADGLAVVGPFHTCGDAWRWVESLPAWRQALVRPALMERPTHTTGVAP